VQAVALARLFGRGHRVALLVLVARGRALVSRVIVSKVIVSRRRLLVARGGLPAGVRVRNRGGVGGHGPTIMPDARPEASSKPQEHSVCSGFAMKT
jgi:hypothetical protein